MVSMTDIQKVFKGTIRLREPIAKYTSLGIGGPADYFAEPASKEDAVNVITYFRKNSFPFIIIANQSNLLVSDEGYRGAAITLESGVSHVRMNGELVYAESGLQLGRLIDFCIQRSLGGLEPLSGISGTLGGALVLNAGANGRRISDYMVEVEVLRDNTVVKMNRTDAGVPYRRSGLNRDVILSATFRLPNDDKEQLMRTRREALTKRNENRPLNIPNAATMFKDPVGGSAAALIREARLTGRSSGGAVISERYANAIVNTGGAKAKDVLELIKIIRRTVQQKCHTVLDLDLKLVGFDEHELAGVN